MRSTTGFSGTAERSRSPAALCASIAAVALTLACAMDRSDRAEEALEEPVRAELCDGETSVELASVPKTRTEGQAAADAMMSAWRAKNLDANWESAVRSRHFIAPAADNSAILSEGQSPGHTGARFTQRDLLVWKRETERWVVEGARVFHSADELGSTIAVSCDMCHPDAANTHPETYPKFQVQLGKAVLLRDMVNWCLEHPCRAQPLSEDDPRLRALEAYIYAQRTGKPLEYGKH